MMEKKDAFGVTRLNRVVAPARKYRGKRTFADPFKSAHLSTIFHGMNSEINLRYGLLLLYRPDCIVHLHGASLVLRDRHSGGVSIHGESVQLKRLVIKEAERQRQRAGVGAARDG